VDAVEKAVLKKFKGLLLKKVPLCGLILFGSRARGDADPGSDMDVIVIVKGKGSEQIRDYVSDCAWEAGFEHGIVVVPVVFTRNEWEHGPERHSLLVQAAKAEGILL
jgi:predicted nucleotidyltransferase